MRQKTGNRKQTSETEKNKQKIELMGDIGYKMSTMMMVVLTVATQMLMVIDMKVVQ